MYCVLCEACFLLSYLKVSVLLMNDRQSIWVW